MIGIFNVTMLISKQYGRSLASDSLYRMSSSGQWYNFETYAGLFIISLDCSNILDVFLKFCLVLNDVSPKNGSAKGGTVLTIRGNYFSNSNRYPLVVNIGGVSCPILITTLTVIQCQVPNMPDSHTHYYHGKLFIQQINSSY